MATTAKDLIQAAFGSRTTNDKTLALVPELIRVLSRRLQWIYERANQDNPWYFAAVTTVTPDGTKWARPAGSAVIYAYGGGDAGTGAAAVLDGGTDPEDDRVNIVPLRDLSAELAPRIYLVGRNYMPGGGVGDPSASVNGDKINFVCSRVHAALDPTAAWDAPGNTLESAWPEHHNSLLVAELERYLAKKDGRTADVALIAVEIDGGEGRPGLLASFLEEVRKDNQAIATRWGVRTPHAGEA